MPQPDESQGHGAPAPTGPPAPPPPPQAADRRVSCPECGEVAEPGQELCLRCGARVGRTYRRPPSWRVPAALAALGILLIGAGAGFAVADLTHEKGKSKSTVVPLTPQTTASSPALPTAPTTTTNTPSTTTAAPTTTTSPGGSRGVVPVPTPGGTTKSTPLAKWPARKSAYTAELATAKSRAAAEAKARAAIKKGAAAGVLRAKDYPGVPGPWVVFAGQYTLASDARAAAQRYVKQGFPGAHAQLVKPRGSH